jgi:hypothetical protein
MEYIWTPGGVHQDRWLSVKCSIYAQWLLSLLELQHALAILPWMTDIDPESLVPELLLTSVCAGLVVIDEYQNIVHLVCK